QLPTRRARSPEARRTRARALGGRKQASAGTPPTADRPLRRRGRSSRREQGTRGTRSLNRIDVARTNGRATDTPAGKARSTGVTTGRGECAGAASDAGSRVPRDGGAAHPDPGSASRAPSIVGAPGRVPEHVAIIMDGNGRWAARRGWHRIAGHRAGTENIRE